MAITCSKSGSSPASAPSSSITSTAAASRDTPSAEGVLHGVEDAAVHKLQRGRNDARGYDLAYDLRGVVDRTERGADRAAGLRYAASAGPKPW